MGAGASAGVTAGVSAASPDELAAALKGMPADAQEKLKTALGGGGGAPAAAAPAAAGDYPPNGLSEGVKKLPEWIQLGCGDKDYICEEKKAVFPGDACPDALPDLSEHNNFVVDVLKSDPAIYEKLKGLKTEKGFTLAKCLKTGIDNKGHPNIKTVGLVGADEESFTLFKDLFDPVISARHGGYAPDATHPTDMDPANLLQEKIDPTGNYTVTTRCRTGRSVRGFSLPPGNSFQERRDLEAVMVKGLLSLEGELKGDYFPLHGSRSYAPKPTGMSHDEEEAFRSSGNLFQEPDSTLLLSSGCGRHWPDARGIFANEARNFFVWCNEEDHMRIVSMEKGDNVEAIFKRFCAATEGVAKVLKEQGSDFMRNDHLGYILTCPSNLGTGLRCGTIAKLPNLSKREDWKAFLGKMGLQARGTAGVDSVSNDGRFDLSNADRLGKSETTLVNIFIRGVKTLIEWEQKLEKGESVDDEIAAAKPWSKE
jgi:creatine kinase